jgi:hypothetical protein
MSRVLDKFYTSPSVVEQCYRELGSLDTYDLMVEPSAGSGAFLVPLPANLTVKSYDIAPESKDYPIQQADFLTLTPAQIKGDHKKVLTVGNPPFGVNSSLCLKFIKHASLYSQTIAFILPKSFKKISTQGKVPLTHSLTKSVDLPDNAFLLDGKPYSVPCVFQIWDRTDVPRIKKVGRTTTELFEFVTQDRAELSVRRVGVYAGKAFTETDKSVQSHYFLKLREGIDINEFVEKCNTLEWEHNNTAGPRSVAKGELIEKMEGLWE